MNNTGISAYYSPEHYIKTRPATVLAVLKVIEIILATVGLLFMLRNDLPLSEAIGNYMKSFGGNSSYTSLLAAEGVVLKVITWVGIAGLAIMILDSVCVVLLRITGRFSGVIRLIHTLIFIAMVVAIALAIIGIVAMVRSMGQAGTDLSAYSRGFTLAYSGIALAGIGLTFEYHRNIASIMKTIGIERKTGTKRAVRQSSLPRLCTYYAWVIAIPTVLLAASWAVVNFIDLPAHSALADILRVIGAVENMTLPAIIAEVGIGVFSIIKFAVVGSCAKVFNREHL